MELENNEIEQAQEPETVEIEIDDAGAAEGGNTGGMEVGGMGEQEEPSGDAAGSGDPKRQDMEERHRQATAGRLREERERQAAHQAEIDAVYARAYQGVTNPYTGKPIRSKADFEAYEKAYAEDERRQSLQQMQENGVDAELLQKLIREAVANDPIVKQAGVAVEEANAARVKARAEQVKTTLEHELELIAAIDPRIRAAGNDPAARMEKMKELAGDNWGTICQNVRAGMDLNLVWKGANFDLLMKNTSAASRQAAMNAANSKAHIKTSKNNNKSTVTMPREQLEAYRKIMPGKSDAEYAKHWAKSQKKER